MRSGEITEFFTRLRVATVNLFVSPFILLFFNSDIVLFVGMRL